MFTSTAKVIVFIIMATFYFTGGTITDKVAFLTLSSFNQTTFIITIYLPHCKFNEFSMILIGKLEN